MQTTSSDGTRRSRAIQRLMRDLQELENEPCRTVSAAPMEDNMLWYTTDLPWLSIMCFFLFTSLSSSLHAHIEFLLPL